ncbi:alpha/beta hydrolase [Longispora sp. K20-0274]|uniref:alpha/beta fold hydrolase n=1 Tax=Longispora sp. K20-0274 TaxID=3088255 RepID=UPI00399A0926
MRNAQVRPDGSRIRWTELPGTEPARVYLHGLGAASGPYFTGVATHPALAGRRSLLVDLLGFGLSDRPADAAYTPEEHADAVAAALTAAGVDAAEVVGHSMGGAVAITLAVRHPHLVSGLVLVDSNLDPQVPVRRPGSSGIATYTEEEFLAGGRAEVLATVGPHWAATMRLAGPEALYRSAASVVRGTTGGRTFREHLLGLDLPRTFLHPAADGGLDGEAELVASGVRVVAVPDTGHNITLDNPEAFVGIVARAA